VAAFDELDEEEEDSDSVGFLPYPELSEGVTKAIQKYRFGLTPRFRGCNMCFRETDWLAIGEPGEKCEL
jgi:hypothetical protein